MKNESYFISKKYLLIKKSIQKDELHIVLFIRPRLYISLI